METIISSSNVAAVDVACVTTWKEREGGRGGREEGIVPLSLRKCHRSHRSLTPNWGGRVVEGKGNAA